MLKSLLLKGRFMGMLLCFLISSLAATAQTKYKGKIIGSDDKLPVVGASVRVKGTTTGAVTDVNGDFTLTLKAGDVITVSYIGYQTTDITVGANTNLSITLKAGNNSLNEVVVTGYGTQRKKDLVGAVAVVSVAALNKQPTGSVENQLQGQAAGVTVVASGQPGETPAVKIRGANTFGNNQPLYIVDGVPTTNVNDFNPNDIETMQVLKDASSASIYGARASNGVIIITTKRGKGKTNVSYDAYYGTQQPKGGNVYDLLNPTEMMQLTTLAAQNTARIKGLPVDYVTSNLYGPNNNVLPDYIAAGGAGPFGIHDGDPAVDPAKYSVKPFYTSGDPSGFYRITRANKAGTDWYHEIFSSAPIQSHNLNVNGATDKAAYLFSMNYFNQQGTLLNTYLKRYTIRANTSYNLTDHIRVGENISYAISENPQINQNDEGSSIGMSFREQPIIPVYDIKGNYAGSNTKNLGNARNPRAIADRTKNNYGITNRLFGNVFAEVDFLKYFTIRTQFGGEYYSNYNHSFTYPEYENSENNTTNSYTENSYNGYSYTWTNTLTYHQVIGKHDIKLLVGNEAVKNRYQALGATNTGYFIFDPNYTTITSGTGSPTAYSFLQKDRLYSPLIARLDYTFNDKYLLNATIRRDGSTRFLNTVYGWFPAVSAGWRISQEDFFKGVSWINDLKIRAGYGVMGNQNNVTPPNAFTTFAGNRTNSYYDIGGTSTSTVPGFTQKSIGNPDAKWESDKNFNVGFDGTFFNQKLEITADYYKKTITDLLYNPNLAGTYGTAIVPYSNVGAMDNTGVDVAITTHHNLSSDLKMNATLTFTTYHNVIKKVTLGQPYFEQNPGRFNGSNIIRNQVGGPVGGFFGYQVDGFWNSQAEIDAANQKAGGNYQTDAAPGRFKYADINGDGKITAADRTLLGNPNPKFTGGLNLDFSYKQFDLSMFWYGSYGNKIWNDTKWYTDFYTNFLGAKSKTALYDSWTPTHMNAKAPVQEVDGTFSSVTVPNSYYVENGSYLRLRNAQIGYTFNPKILKSVGIDRLRVYLSGANLITITKYSGVDPEIVGSGSGNQSVDTNLGVINNSATNSSTNFGIDRGNYSPVRTYLLGLQVKF